VMREARASGSLRAVSLIAIFAASEAADQLRAAPELFVQALEQPPMPFSFGRQRLPRMRPSTLEFMWQIT
jgi:hypothetical protein